MRGRAGRALLDGPVILPRLSPVDYHHIHYPDDGRTLDPERLGRRTWEVPWRELCSPSRTDISTREERQVNILRTRAFRAARLGRIRCPDRRPHRAAPSAGSA